ncbi:processed acidic surface protein [Oceanobacillus sp. J11TS1]|uniref:processed acidic surface protein n=1 Tax=Oceanobacillus sp. J11TS1 TaxID=2807191 RepID=UPI001B0A15ED|nr:processed acidic surface protein [Oceanobacillus sp. J11TS1]GIO24475.1 hypothetical protein J11TS1_30560 [Oceanobacillus sp. J11TS1]
MKTKLLSVCFAFILMIGLLPSQAFAIAADDPELEEFLESIDWELEDYEEYLAEFDFELADFEEVDYLGTPVTEETLEDIYNTYNLNHDELNKLLYEEEGFLEEGEDFTDSFWYMFIEDIELSLELIASDPLGSNEEFSEEEISEENLQAVAEEHGFDSIEELEELFNTYEDSINNYTTLYEIKTGAEMYIALEDEELLEDNDLSSEDELWEEDYLQLDTFENPIISEDPILDIYAMIAIMLLESAADL